MLTTNAPGAPDYNVQKKKENVRRCILYGVGVGGVRAIGKITNKISEVRVNNSTGNDDWAAAKTKIFECREIQENGLHSLEQICSTAFLGIPEIRGLLAASLKLQLTPDELMSLLDAFGCIETTRKKGKEIRRVVVNKFLTCFKRLDACSREEDQKSRSRKESQIRKSNCSDNDSSILKIEKEDQVENSSNSKSQNANSVIEGSVIRDIVVKKQSQSQELTINQGEKNTVENAHFRKSKIEISETATTASDRDHKRESQTLSSQSKRMLTKHCPVVTTTHINSNANKHSKPSPSKIITAKNQSKNRDKSIVSHAAISIPLTAKPVDPANPAIRECATLRRKSESPETEETRTCYDPYS